MLYMAYILSIMGFEYIASHVTILQYICIFLKPLYWLRITTIIWTSVPNYNNTILIKNEIHF